MTGMNRNQLIEYLDLELNSERINDYCPNGLQVEGSPTIQTIVGGVTANQALIEHAIKVKADALLVHHGYFWKGEAQPITGMKQRRIKALLAHDINLIAYHLPLDLHLQWGNNRGLADCLSITDDAPDQERLLRFGRVTPMSIDELIERVTQRLNRAPLHLAGGSESIECIAWCTGGAQDMIEEAAQSGADVFLSGEVSERTTHLAQELGIHYLACGHHATETFGVERLGNHLAQRFNLNFEFINLPNPV